MVQHRYHPSSNRNARDQSWRLYQLKANTAKDHSITHLKGAVFQHFHLTTQSAVTGLNQASSVITDPDQKLLLFPFSNFNHSSASAPRYRTLTAPHRQVQCTLPDSPLKHAMLVQRSPPGSDLQTLGLWGCSTSINSRKDYSLAPN